MKKLLITIITSFLLWSCSEEPNPTVNSSTAGSFTPIVKVSSKGYTCAGKACAVKSYIIFYDNNTQVAVTKEKYDSTNIGDPK